MVFPPSGEMREEPFLHGDLSSNKQGLKQLTLIMAIGNLYPFSFLLTFTDESRTVGKQLYCWKYSIIEKENSDREYGSVL